MKNIIRLLVLSIIVGMVLWLAGCTEETTAPTQTPSTEIKTIQPKGYITGKIYDRCTGMPIDSAKISVGFEGEVFNMTSDASGSFSFANVPAGSYKVIDGRSVPTGTYLLTVSLVEYNKQQTESTKRYRDYYYYPVTITFTSLVPGDSLGVSGLVGAVACSLSTLSTTITGTVVDQNNLAQVNATVTIFDYTTSVEVGQTRTVAEGVFQFSNLENGTSFYITAASADGSIQTSSAIMVSNPCNISTDTMRSQVYAERIVLVPSDNVAPYVTSIAPENGSDVATSAQFVYTFSEPIKQNAYTVTSLGVGHGTIVDDITITFNGLKKTQAALPAPVIAWNPTFTQLTVTPSGLAGSAKYTLNAAIAMGKLKDFAGNALVNNTLITGDFEALNFTTAGGTTGPAAPTLTRRYVPNVYVPLDYTGGTVALSWSADPNANAIRSYNIYRSFDGGPFEIYRKDVYAIRDTVSTGPLYFVGTASSPYAAKTVSFEVSGVSRDLVEGPLSSPLPVSDEVSPALNSVAIAGPTGPAPLNWWTYTLRFSEPLKISTAEVVANYSILNPDTVTFAITKADYLGYNAGTTSYLVQLIISSNLPVPAGYSLRASGSITDLAGNAMDATANAVTFSAPRVPALSTPLNGATGVGLPATLSWSTANGAVSYRLQVSTNVGFTGIVFDRDLLTSTSYAVSSTYLTAGITYYWRVYATNAATVGTSAASAVRSFTP